MVLVEQLAYATPIKVSRHSADPTYQVSHYLNAQRFGPELTVERLTAEGSSALNAQVFSLSHVNARWKTSGLNLRSAWLNQRWR